MKVVLAALIGWAAILLFPMPALALAPDYCPPPLPFIQEVGRKAIIDGCMPDAESSQRGERGSGSAAQQVGEPENDLLALKNERADPEVKAQTKYHVVKPTDTLLKIAETYNTSTEALMLANPQITNPDIIYDDDRLKIPTQAETNRLRTEAEKRRIASQRNIVSTVPHQGQRWIDVDLQTQTVRAYEGDTLLKTFLASTGTANYPTVTGQFQIWLKLEADDMSGPGYHLKDVPYVMYFFEDYALHGTYWHDNVGTPMSHGCVNLRTEDAAWLFDFGSEGTLVNVH